MKPVLDHAGIQYQLIDPDHVADLVKEARNLMWDAKTQLKEDHEYLQKVQVWEAKRGWWTWFFGFGLTDQEREMVLKREEQDAIRQQTPHLYRPRYNPLVSLIAVGPNAWRHVLYGLETGLTTPVGGLELETWSEEREPMQEVELPVLGFVPCQTIKGFVRFPIRMFHWFIKRYQIEIVARETLKIVEAQTRAFEPSDWFLGDESFSATAKKKEEERDVIRDEWTEKAESTPISNSLIRQLRIYK
jgi:hypothetical protein